MVALCVCECGGPQTQTSVHLSWKVRLGAPNAGKKVLWHVIYLSAKEIYKHRKETAGEGPESPSRQGGWLNSGCAALIVAHLRCKMQLMRSLSRCYLVLSK